MLQVFINFDQCFIISIKKNNSSYLLLDKFISVYWIIRNGQVRRFTLYTYSSDCSSYRFEKSHPWSLHFTSRRTKLKWFHSVTHELAYRESVSARSFLGWPSIPAPRTYRHVRFFVDQYIMMYVYARRCASGKDRTRNRALTTDKSEVVDRKVSHVPWWSCVISKTSVAFDEPR